MYWVQIITIESSEVRLNQVSDAELAALMPILAELGADAKFGLNGSEQILGGCLATCLDSFWPSVDTETREFGANLLIPCTEARNPDNAKNR